MNSVRQILSRKKAPSISISPDAPVIEALKLMAEMNVGSIIVLQGEKYMGILTERDYSRKIVLQGKSSTSTRTSEIMSVDLPRLSPEDTVDRCMELMSDKNIRYLPVFENEKLIGLISMSDVVKQTIIAQQETIQHLEKYIHQ